MEIYNSSGELVLSVVVDDNSYRYRAIMGDNALTLYYSLAEHVELPVGAWCEYQGETYTLKRYSAFKMQHSRLFEYTVTLEADQADASFWKFRNTVDGRLKFSLTATPLEHLQMFVDNMNRRGSGWEVGECVDGTETLINYDHAYCIDALKQMADEFETEYEISGKVVSLHKVEYFKDSPLALSYGAGNGFKSGVSRDNTEDIPAVEILYTQGGTDNIDPSSYGNSELLLPKGVTIQFDGTYFEDEDGFDEENARTYVTDDDGLSIRRGDKDLSTMVEDSLDCSEIYPKRVGTISAVVVEDEDENFYDFYDNSIPDALDYGDYLIDGETMTVIFQSGMLAGREFEVAYTHDATSTRAARRFEIVPQEIDGQTMPNATFCPAVNDTYAIFHCALPDAYICDDDTLSGASWDMFREGVRYLYEHEDDLFTFTGELDGIWARENWANVGGKIVLGGYISFTDERFQQEAAHVRIVGIKDYINRPYCPELELSNATVTGGVSSTIKALESQEVLIADAKREAISFTKRRFRDAKETMVLLETALLENFTESISPIAIQTMQLLVGDESLQFRFVSSTDSPVAVSHTVNWDNDSKQLTCDAGIIQHMTLGITSLSSTHETGEYLFWEVEEFASAYLEDGDTAYYLYARVPVNGSTGEFLLSATAIALEGESGYYHLLVGILNSEYDGGRSFVALYGYTEITPGRVTTERVVSSDGESYFDMADNAMKLGDSLQFNIDGTGLLKLKGTIVQSESGDESYIGCYRGVYSSAYTYYNGDTVTYTSGGVTSLYRCVTSESAGITGIAPTVTSSWAVQAQGSKGDDGQDGTSISLKGACKGHFASISELADTGVEYQTIKSLILIDDISDYTDFGGVVVDDYSGPGIMYCRIGSAVGEEDFNISEWELTAAEEGDCYVSSEDGHLFVAGSDGWTDCGNITGTDGDYTELRYQANGSATNAPDVDSSEREPDGWDTEMPSVDSLEFLWVITAKISGADDSLLSDWTTPVRMTGADGADGKDGSDGVSPAAVYRGVWSSGETYYGNSYRVDVVKYGSAYYVARTDAGTINDSSILPTNTGYWNSFGASFSSVATELLAADLANIAGFIFRNSRLESQTLADGSTSTGETTETPMLYLNGETGEASFGGGKFTVDSDGNATMQDVTMQDVTAESGTFKGLLNANEGLIFNVEEVTSFPYKMSSGTPVIVALPTSASSNIITLPTSPNAGQVYYILNRQNTNDYPLYLYTGTTSISITPSCEDSGSATLNWEAGYYFYLARRTAVQLVFSNSEWWVISSYQF